MPAPTPQPRAMFAAESWVMLPEMPPDASQADYGAEVYRLVCSTCHGDIGQGLTDEFRATSRPENQNCWQSKCHASNHPVDGFVFPRYVPPLVGSHIPATFATAQDLYAFISTRMPYQVPGTMTEEEYWQLTAFILELNGYEVDEIVLDFDKAVAFELR